MPERHSGQFRKLRDLRLFLANTTGSMPADPWPEAIARHAHASTLTHGDVARAAHANLVIDKPPGYMTLAEAEHLLGVTDENRHEPI